MASSDFYLLDHVGVGLLDQSGPEAGKHLSSPVAYLLHLCVYLFHNTNKLALQN